MKIIAAVLCLITLCSCLTVKDQNLSGLYYSDREVIKYVNNNSYYQINKDVYIYVSDSLIGIERIDSINLVRTYRVMDRGTYCTRRRCLYRIPGNKVLIVSRTLDIEMHRVVPGHIIDPVPIWYYPNVTKLE